MTAIAASYELGPTLPGLFQDDDIVQSLCAAVDQIMAPVVCALDSMPAYFDPMTTREDMVEWLAQWVGLTAARSPSPRDRRDFVKQAVALHARRGTPDGVAAAVRMWFGSDPEVLDSGGTGWSLDPDAPLPGGAPQGLLVILRVADPGRVDRRLLNDVVAALKPAHVPHETRVEPLGRR